MKQSIIQINLIIFTLFLFAQDVCGDKAPNTHIVFEIDEFISDVNAVHELKPEIITPLRRMQRSDGLRFSIELSSTSKSDRVFGVLKEKFNFRYPVQIEPLFPKTTKKKLFVGFHPELYYQLKIPNYAYEDLKFNVFDLAYFLRKLTGEDKIDPDIPFEGFYPMSGSTSCNSHYAQTSDTAWPLRNVNSGTPGAKGGMNIEAAWDYAQSQDPPKPHQGQGIRIAHPDTGYNDHEDFKTNQENIDLGSGFDTVDNDPDPTDPLNYGGSFRFPGHGISTGSVMISTGEVISQPPAGQNGGTGPPGIVTGIAPQATLIPIRCMRSPVRLFFGSVVQAIDHALSLSPPNECHVISMSLGGLPSASLKTAIAMAVSRNIIVIAAAGNYTWFVVYPAAFSNCIAVAASNAMDEIWSGSASGSEVDFAAPGESVWRALRNDPFDPLNDAQRGCGTSLSTVNVAGIAALWLAYHGRQNLIHQLSGNAKLQDLFRDQVKRTVRVPSGWNTGEHGEGIVDAKQLLEDPISRPVMAKIDTSHLPFNYLDIIIGIFGKENSKIISELLAATFKTDQSELEKVINFWGAELSYLLYFNSDLYKLITYMIADTHRPVQVKASILAREIKKRSSSKLAQFLTQ